MAPERQGFKSWGFWSTQGALLAGSSQGVLLVVEVLGFGHGVQGLWLVAKGLGASRNLVQDPGRKVR